MKTDRATAPSPGRIARLAVVIAADDPAMAARVARMCEVADIGALWLRAHGPSDPAGILTALSRVANATSTLALGVTPATAAVAAGAARAPTGRPHLLDRLQLCATAPSDLPAIAAAMRHISRSLLSVYVADGAQAVAAADLADVLVVPTTPSQAGLTAAVGDVCESLRAAGRPPGTVGVAVELPISIGRTVAEAEARAARTRGDIASWDAALFGTLEQCQAQAHELVHAGATELRCIVPMAPDVDDVIAQLTAVAIGDRATLLPGLPRSPDPLPPAGWGGPPTRPGSTDDGHRR